MLIHCIQPYLITNMSSNARGDLTLLHTRSHKLRIEVASWYQNVTNLKACKVYAMNAWERMIVTCSSHARHIVQVIQDMLTY